jgi:ubiquinone/menaquinone biosynthesis C-methylase UbiE
MEIFVKDNYKAKYSSQYSDQTDEWRRLGAIRKSKNILEITKGEVFKRVLEVGAGDGSILKYLSEQNFSNEFYAVEISESGLKQIVSKEIKHLVNAQLFDGYHLPFADKFFDLVILTHVLEHVEHERLLLRELHRVAHKVVLEVPKDYRFAADKKIKHFLSYGHINIYTPTFLKFLVLTERFEVLDESYKLYDKEIFLFGKNTYLSKLKANLDYFGKKALTSIPIDYLKFKFISTITLYLKSNHKESEIF